MQVEEQSPEEFDEDAPTIVSLRDNAPPPPPPLPFPLRRMKSTRDVAAWLDTLPEEAQRILRRAAVPAPSWPIAPRVPGAVATPAFKIPSLRTMG